MVDRRDAKQFEPPPWEREAFERFQRDKAAERSEAELEDALAALRREDVTSATGDQEALSPECAAPDESPVDGESHDGATAPPEARIDAMLIELRGEEPTVRGGSRGLATGVVVVFVVIGLVMIVQAAVLFGRTGGGGGLLGALVSMIVLVVGLAFIGGGALLFRKYHS